MSEGLRPGRPVVAAVGMVLLVMFGAMLWAGLRHESAPLSPPIGSSAIVSASGAAPSGPACRPSPGQYDPWDGVVPTSAPSDIELVPVTGVRRPVPSTKPVPMVVHGRVLDTACRPIAGAFVWAVHRDPDGNYGPEASGGGDNVFYYQGTARTDADGRFSMTSVRPGVPSGPSHIHVLVMVPGGPRRLSLEVWFADDPELPSSTGGAVLASPVPYADGGIEIDVTLVFDPSSKAPGSGEASPP